MASRLLRSKQSADCPTHLLWFFVFEVVDVEIKGAGDGQAEMGDGGDQLDPVGPLLLVVTVM